MKLALLVCALLFTVIAAAQEPDLTSDTLPHWRNHIVPAGEDLNWQKIPWLTTFADGIKAANDADKPLLLWTMNGHPLGCT